MDALACFLSVSAQRNTYVTLILIGRGDLKGVIFEQGSFVPSVVAGNDLNVSGHWNIELGCNTPGYSVDRDNMSEEARLKSTDFLEPSHAILETVL